jgi:hypothetical protein
VLTYRNHVVERGKWFPKEARLFKQMNIGCDFSRRPVMSASEYYLWWLRYLFSHMVRPIPWDMRQKAKAIIKHILTGK